MRFSTLLLLSAASALLGNGQGAASAIGEVRAASAVAYPAKPLRWLVGTSPGGGTDFSARAYATRVSQLLGSPIVVDNRSGATGMIAMDVVANATPDGYSLLVLNVGHVMTAVLSERLAFHLLKDFAPVALLATTPSAMVIHPSVNAATLQDFINLARSQPGKINYASGGIGGVQHLLTELLKREARIDVAHVPYKGSGPAVVALIAGQVQLGLISLPSTLPHIKAGRLRGLAVTGKTRTPTAPNLPTFAESGLSGVAVDIWYGIVAPARTPPIIIQKLAGTIASVARGAEFREMMSSAGLNPVESTPAEFGSFLRAEASKWSVVAREAGIRID